MTIWQKLHVGRFKWVKGTFEFSKDFTQKYNEDSDKEYFLEAAVQYLKNYMNFTMI